MSILISIIGYPGFGKTTQCHLIKKVYGDHAVVLSVPQILNMDEENICVLTKDEQLIIHSILSSAKQKMKKGYLVDREIDKLLYTAVNRYLRTKDIVVIDGSPRDFLSLKLFMSTVNDNSNSRSILFRLITNKDAIDFSVLRQEKREYKRSEEYDKEAAKRFLNKAKVFSQLEDTNIKSYLYSNSDNIEYYEIDCENTFSDISEEICNIINSSEKRVIHNQSGQ